MELVQGTSLSDEAGQGTVEVLALAEQKESESVVWGTRTGVQRKRREDLDSVRTSLGEPPGNRE